MLKLTPLLIVIFCLIQQSPIQAQESFELFYTFPGNTCSSAPVGTSNNGVVGSPFVRVGLDCNDYEDNMFGWRASAYSIYNKDRYVRVIVTAPPGKLLSFTRPQAHFLISTFKSFSGSSYFEMAAFVNGSDSLFYARVRPSSDINVTAFTPNLPNASSIEFRIYPWLAGIEFQGWDAVYVFRIAGKLVNQNATSTTNDTANIPSGIELLDAYPNPFNPSTNVPFKLDRTAKVTIEVYDLIGRKVETIINDKTYQPGRHIEVFNSGSLSSGTYMYRLVVDGQYHQTSMFTIIK